MAKPSKSIRTKKIFQLPPYVRKALQKLDEAGHVAYVVGGSVRDFLLDRDAKDIDLVTSADPETLCQIFPDSITTGKLFGVIRVPTHTKSKKEQQYVEVATFRQDLEYVDFRHPRGVVFAGPLEDAARRDFTVNALFFDPKTSTIIDYVDGVADLKAGLIRAVGDPNERFREDALRLLRAIRFKTRLGFEFEPGTAAAIRSRAHLISKISVERIRDELTLMWQGPRPQEALKLLSEFGLLKYILPEVEAVKHLDEIYAPGTLRKEDIWGHLSRVLGHLAAQMPSRSRVLAWLSVLHEVGRPVALRANQGLNFNGHETEGRKIAELVAHRLRMSRAEAETLGTMIAEHIKFRGVFQMREATFQRFIRQENFEELLAFHRADATAGDGNLAYYEFCASRLETLKNEAGKDQGRILDGDDLIQLGFTPGPGFAEILRVVEDLTLERKLTTKEEALEFVLKNFVR
ncbi:MAG: CCA tRNA nucleotidyltransferase [Bdellovibrio sp.]|nr:CCA tRNA nucleotidyltransferase [Bdellovibrio sp.]